jgi:hypothetical protein
MTSVIDHDEFAQAWIAAWNARDLDAILSHYADDVAFVSPNVVRWLGDESGTVCGKSALRAYFEQALAAQPDLCFKLARVYRGVSSLCLEYERHDGRRGAEVMEFSKPGHVARVVAHYAPA